jgi:hypothetical protein
MESTSSKVKSVSMFPIILTFTMQFNEHIFLSLIKHVQYDDYSAFCFVCGLKHALIIQPALSQHIVQTNLHELFVIWILSQNKQLVYELLMLLSMLAAASAAEQFGKISLVFIEHYSLYVDDMFLFDLIIEFLCCVIKHSSNEEYLMNNSLIVQLCELVIRGSFQQQIGACRVLFMMVNRNPNEMIRILTEIGCMKALFEVSCSLDDSILSEFIQMISMVIFHEDIS